MPVPDKYISTFSPSFVMQKIRGDVGFFKEKGGTVGWMVNDEGMVVIDTQFKSQAVTLLSQIKMLSKLKIDVLFNTHHHTDHTGGNIIFKDEVEHIIAHINSLHNQRKDAALNQAEHNQYYPDSTFEDSFYITIGNEKINAKYLGPAHTNGDIIVHFENANVVHIGDLVFNRCYPYIDTKNGGSIVNWIKVLNRINEKFDKDTLFITGHALPTYDVVIEKKDIKAFADYLEQLMVCGIEWLKQGRTKDWVLEKVKLLPNMGEWQGEGIERSIIAVYDELFQTEDKK
jgi:cyclase